MSPSPKQNKLLLLENTHFQKIVKQKELITYTFKAINHPILKYANTIWNPNISNTIINKLKINQNKEGLTLETNP